MAARCTPRAASLGILSRLRARRRARLAAAHPIPDELWAWALSQHRMLAGLDAEEASLLRELATAFLAEKRFSEARGALAGTETRLSVAVQACLPLLRLGLDWYDDWTTIIVVPREFSVTRRDVDRAGVVTEYDDELAGQVLEFGPVLLSLEDVEASGWGDGYNVVIHEMAHKLDERDGELDGCPPLPRDIPGSAWRDAFSSAYADFREKAERPGTGRRRRGRGGLPMDEYAATGPDEFFAVACEYFFERPFRLRDAYPEVYGLLAAFFAQDPAERLGRVGDSAKV